MKTARWNKMVMDIMQGLAAGFIVISLMALAGCGGGSSATEVVPSLSDNVISELSASLGASQTAANIAHVKAVSRASLSVSAATLDLTDAEIDEIIADVTAAVDAAGLSDSTDLIAIGHAIMTGCAEGIVGLSTEESERADALALAAGSLVDSLDGRGAYLLDSAAESGLTALETALNNVAEDAVGLLDDAGVATANAALYVGNLSAIVLEHLDNSGLAEDQLAGAIRFISRGSIEGLDDIAGVAEADIGQLISQVSAGHTGALDELSGFSWFDAAHIAGIVDDIGAGAIEGFNGFNFSFFDVSDVASYINAASSGAVGAFGNISMAGVAVDNFGDWAGAVAAGGVGALGRISVTGFTVDHLDDFAGAVSAGALMGLDDISYTGYDYTYFDDFASRINQYAVGALDGIVYTGYDASMFDDMVTGIVGGATSALGALSYTGYDASFLDDMMQNISDGATRGFGYIEYSGFDASYLGTMAQGVASGATMWLDDISMSGYDASMLQAMTEAISAGAATAMGYMGAYFGSEFDSDSVLSGFATGVAYASQGFTDADFMAYQGSMDDWMSAGMLEGAGGAFIPPDIGNAFNDGLAMEWHDPGFTGEYQDYGDMPMPETPPPTDMTDSDGDGTPDIYDAHPSDPMMH